MTNKREQAELLRKEGKSYREIGSLIGVPQSTLSYWFRGQDWSKKIGDELRKQNTEKGTQELFKYLRARSFALRFHYEKGKEDARKEFKVLKKNPLFISGMSLYWGEGDRTSKYFVRLANIDPQMILLFSRFLREICEIPEGKIRYWLLLYPDLNDETCRAYWAEKAKIPLQNFTKSIFIRGKHKTKRLSYGVCTIILSSRYMKEKMLVWLRLLADEFAPLPEEKR